MGKLFIIFRLHLDNIFPLRGQPTLYDFWFARKCRLSKTADFGSFWIILDHVGAFWAIFERYTMVPNSVPNIKSLAALVQDISGGVDFDPPAAPGTPKYAAANRVNTVVCVRMDVYFSEFIHTCLEIEPFMIYDCFYAQ